MAGEVLRPRLRPVEAFPVDGGEGPRFAVRDPTGMADAVLTLSEPALFILTLFDGEHTLEEVRAAFAERYGQAVGEATLREMVDRLRQTRLLAGPEFDAYVASLVEAYRAAPVRRAVYAAGLGDGDAVRSLMSEMVPAGAAVNGDRLLGLVAPHLDYPRGRPCYEHAYRALAGREAPRRVCLFGTNHFGRATSVVATSKAFETPLGVTPVDTEFLEGVEARCGVSLRMHEFDHAREHSIEMQVLFLQHLFGPDAFKIVPFLCPDPCGPTGTQPIDGEGVDLAVFAQAVRAVADDCDGDTLLIAGADLSHVGAQFGDAFRLDADFLKRVEQRDRAALHRLEQADPEAFVQAVATDANPTRVCSAGCLYVVGKALADARPRLLHYHQAFDEDVQVCVSCSALVYVR